MCVKACLVLVFYSHASFQFQNMCNIFAVPRGKAYFSNPIVFCSILMLHLSFKICATYLQVPGGKVNFSNPLVFYVFNLSGILVFTYSKNILFQKRAHTHGSDSFLIIILCFIATFAYDVHFRIS